MRKMNKDETNDILSRTIILKKAKQKWDSKTKEEKVRSSRKYKHIFANLGDNSRINWNVSFSQLSKRQSNIIIKGELIRTYDALSNYDKTKLKIKHNLSKFSSKWFKLPSNDKYKLLNYILNDKKRKI